MNVQVAPIENRQVSQRITETYDYEAVFFGTLVSEPDPSSYSDVLRQQQPDPLLEPEAAHARDRLGATPRRADRRSRRARPTASDAARCSARCS